MANRDRIRDVAKDVGKDAARAAGGLLWRGAKKAAKEATGIGAAQRKWDSSATAGRVDAVRGAKWRHGPCACGTGCGRPAPRAGFMDSRCAKAAGSQLERAESHSARVAELERMRKSAPPRDARDLAARARNLRRGLNEDGSRK
jgi:hypothetical protein